MLDRAFNQENPFWTFVNKVIDIAILELLWILTSLPLLTIGASSAAFWNCVLRIAEDDEGHIYKAYFKTFAKTFKTSTFLWLIQFFVTALLIVDVWFCFSVKETYVSFLLGSFAVVGVLFILAGIYFYPLAGRFRYTVKETLTNAFFLGMKHFFHNIAILVMIVAAFTLCYFFHNFWVLLIAPLAAFYLSAKLILWIFDKYPDETADDTPEDPEALSDILDRLDQVSRSDDGQLIIGSGETPAADETAKLSN